MKQKKVIWITAGLLTIIAAAGLAMALASDGSRACPFSGHGFHKRGLPPAIQQDIMDFVLWRMDRGAKELDLSQDQQQQYDRLRSGLKTSVEKGIKARISARDQMAAILEQDSPDLSKAAMEIKDHVDVLSSAVSENLTLFADFFQSLDSDQKQKVAVIFKERMNAHGHISPG